MPIEKGKSAGGATQLPAAAPVELVHMVDYGDGAVVSRTLVKNAAGNLTLFAANERFKMLLLVMIRG